MKGLYAIIIILLIQPSFAGGTNLPVSSEPVIQTYTGTQTLSILAALNAEGVSKVYIEKPIGYNKELGINVFGHNYVVNEAYRGVYFLMETPTGEILYNDTESALDITYTATIPSEMNAGIYVLTISLPDYSGECCITFDFYVRFPNDIPMPFVNCFGMMGRQHDFVSLRNHGSNMKFSAYLIKDIEYTFSIIPWGTNDFYNDLVLTLPSGTTKTLGNEIQYSIVPTETGYYTFTLNMETAEQHLHRFFGIQFWKGTFYSQDAYIPLYIVPPNDVGGDIDRDFILDHEEQNTFYRDPDSDNDGVLDGIEKLFGFNPIDASDTPLTVIGEIAYEQDIVDITIHTYNRLGVVALKYSVVPAIIAYQELSGKRQGEVNLDGETIVYYAVEFLDKFDKFYEKTHVILSYFDKQVSVPYLFDSIDVPDETIPPEENNTTPPTLEFSPIEDYVPINTISILFAIIMTTFYIRRKRSY